MTCVYVVARDRALSDSLRMVCNEIGLVTTCWTNSQLAIAGLSVADEPIVVCLYHGGPDGDCEDILNAANSLPAHVYLVISTRPQRAPRHWIDDTQSFAPVLSAPFDLNDLLDILSAAVNKAALLAENSLARRHAKG